MKVQHVMRWVQSFNVLKTPVLMIALAGPAHQGWMHTQHAWRNWFWKKRVTIWDISAAWDLSIGNVNNIVHKQLRYHKCANWIPRCVMEVHKNWCLVVTLPHLQHLKEGNNFLGSTVTEDETWVHHHFTSQTKQARTQGRHPTSPRAKIFKVCLSVCWKS